MKDLKVKPPDRDRLFALALLNWLAERALAGDETVLRIVRKKAAEGNDFSIRLLESIKSR